MKKTVFNLVLLTLLVAVAFGLTAMFEAPGSGPWAADPIYPGPPELGPYPYPMPATVAPVDPYPQPTIWPTLGGPTYTPKPGPTLQPPPRRSEPALPPPSR